MWTVLVDKYEILPSNSLRKNNRICLRHISSQRLAAIYRYSLPCTDLAVCAVTYNSQIVVICREGERVVLNSNSACN